ncbi:MAG TPA: acetolactate decarboxylase [Candidatus Eisenbacteria bacterium]|nr:acetolactate decarboxylase [Candidatus Eisenbacteria bacterium]
MVATILLGALRLGVVAGPQVQCYGALMEIIHQGRLEGRTTLSAALTHPHGYALGALAGLDGEFIVLDGKAYLSRPDHRGGVVRSTSAGADSAALLVGSHVTSWREIRLSRAVSLKALQELVQARGKAAGLPAGGAYPFLIEGKATHVKWHVADGSKLPPGPSTHEEHAKAAVHGEEKRATATFLGFYSDHDAGTFLHHDSNVHVHALLPGGLAAHVDDAVFEPGAVLRLPKSW